MTIVQRQVGCVVLTLYGFKSSSFFKIFGQLSVFILGVGISPVIQQYQGGRMVLISDGG